MFIVVDLNPAIVSLKRVVSEMSTTAAFFHIDLTVAPGLGLPMTRLYRLFGVNFIFVHAGLWANNFVADFAERQLSTRRRSNLTEDVLDFFPLLQNQL